MPRTIPFSKRRHYEAMIASPALEMHYQPITNARTGRIFKIEALARLRMKGRILMPSIFLPSLSRDGLYNLYVRSLQCGLLQHQRWIQAGFDIRLSINMPIEGLSEKRYYEATKRILSEHACPANCLTLEVLESNSTLDNSVLADEFKKFRSLGLSLAEDDLGSGHSSLVRLRELPFDIVKIDRELTDISLRDPNDTLRMIHLLTRLGHQLGMQVIAEGVESDEILQAMRILGVDGIQGYVIAKPMASDMMLEWLANYSPAQPTAGGMKQDNNLVKLAKLTIWEAQLHSRMEMASTFDMLPVHDDLAMAFGPDARAWLEVLIQAAYGHGMDSAIYQRARLELEDLL